MIHTAVIVFSYYPHDVRVRRETEALLDKGIHVDVICLKHELAPLEEDCYGIHVHRINMKKSRSGLFLYFWEYITFLLRALIKLSILHFKHKYRVVHIHNLPNILVFTAVIPKLFSAKIILDMH